MSALNFYLNGDPNRGLTFEPKMLINAGYTGRNQEEVQKHIDELKKIGVPAPDKIPTFFPKFEDRLTQQQELPCVDEEGHTGEAEYALLCTGGKIYVATGSDHTDRNLEQVSIPKAKQIYPNVISQELWELGEVEGHWDDLILRSWVEQNGEKLLYQEAPLSALMAPKELLAYVEEIIEVPDTEGLVIFSGTFAGNLELDYSPYFEVELQDPKHKRSMSCAYRFKPMGAWFKG